MQLNGFNSDNYRYFRNRETGEIVKYSTEDLKRLLFGSNFTNLLLPNMVEYEVKEYPTYIPFDIIEYIKMQDDIVFKHDNYVDLNFSTKDFLLVTNWLRSKLESNEIPQHPLYQLLVSSQSVRQYNLEKFQYIDSEEYISLDSSRGLISTALALNNGNHLSINTIKHVFQFNRPFQFRVAFKKGEVWKLSNVAIAFILINQKFINSIYQSDEILGQEKENLFYEEYKDNIPNTTIRYYKIKDEIKINELYDLIGDCLAENDKNNGFRSGIARNYGELKICWHNPNNFNSDNSFKYFYVEYFGGTRDITMERELLKIADRLSQSSAIERYKEDIEAYKHHKKEQEAIKYVNEHRARYNKGTNRTMNPIQFMEKEQAREKKDLGRRLIKTLNNRIVELNKSKN